MEEKKTKGSILSVGSINADFQLKVDQEAGSTTTLLGHDFIRLSGGKAANVAFLARRLQVPAMLVGHVGQDDLQEQALTPLEQAGVDLDFVRKVEGAGTGVSMIAVPPGGKKFIMLAANANDSWQEGDEKEVEEAVQKAPEGSVLVVDYEIAPFVVERAVKAARERGFPVILDPSPTDRIQKDLLKEIQYLVPDASETKDLCGIFPDTVKNAARAARKLLESGIENALVKMEEGGCVVAGAKEVFHVPAVSVEVVDTTGAGDAFAGALAVAVLEQCSLPDAASYATAASLATVSKYGSQPAYPNRARLEELFKEVRGKVQFLNE